MSADEHADDAPLWRVHDVRRALGDPDEAVRRRIAKKLGVDEGAIVRWLVARRALDARGNRPPRWVLHTDVELEPGTRPDPPRGANVREVAVPGVRETPSIDPSVARPVIVGMGPCGLFAALQLAEAGLAPVIIDRGKPVEQRAKDVARLMGRGEIDPDSNLCFGEGGAGTWSDGKLYTRVGGSRVREVLESIVRHGGPDRILTDARPHLGTDRLVALLKAFRAALVELGCELRFGAAVDGLVVDGDRVTGLRLRGGETVDATHVILAPGHSARDLYRRVLEAGVPAEPKSFAVGFRVEHPQALIDEIQYGRWAGHEELPPAYYEITANIGRGDDKRGIYSFCMCPGGSVVPTPTREGEICVNGMSHAARSGGSANSALVVTVEPSDVAGWANTDDHGALLAGMRFQQEAEERAWELGGGAFVAPAQRLVEYVSSSAPTEVGKTTYKRGVRPAELAQCYPAFVRDHLVEAVQRFERRMPGYLSDEAVLIGVETRTSAPLRLLRDRESLESPALAGLYPAGEGAGYAGGIVSAAIDGMRVADAILAGLA